MLAPRSRSFSPDLHTPSRQCHVLQTGHRRCTGRDPAGAAALRGLEWARHVSAACAQVLQQLDEEGCARVAAVLRHLPQSTVLLVGQADSYVARTFDAVDVVVKQGGQTTIEAAP